MESTVAAISTGQAPGGIGIVRISGRKAISIADRVFQGNVKLCEAKGYTVHYGNFADQDGVFDEGIALVFRNPKSYTGEDVVELSCHGGLYLTKRLLRAVLYAGAEPAGPGEFTQRAFLNGKMSLTAAESVMDLIGAQGEKAAKAALAARDGALQKKIDRIRQALVTVAAHLNGWADYPEEDLPAVENGELLHTLNEIKNELDYLLHHFDTGAAIRTGVETVILGKPNVGKSTLMNLLSGCEKSIVSPIAGTTRDIVEETVRLGDVLLRLADTAGLRETKDQVEAIGVTRAEQRMERAGLILAVLDGSEPLSLEDQKMLDQVKGKPTIAIINKNDLPQKIAEADIAPYTNHIVTLSAQQGNGLEQLTETIETVLGTKDWNPAEGMLATERQRRAAIRSRESIQEAINALQDGMTLDAVTVEIETAIDALLELTGEHVADSIINEIFSQFCVGK